MSQNISQTIESIITGMMERVMNKVLYEDPFISEKHKTKKPLYAALVPDEIFKGSHFERRFVTPFGRVWEELALAVAKGYHGNASLGHTVTGTIGAERLRRIQETLNRLEHKGNKNKVYPNWISELDYILKGRGKKVPCTVVCDLYVENEREDFKMAFELKAPLPNSDQTKVSKEKLFKLIAMDGSTLVNKAYYALPYNPYGNKSDYKWAFPMRWFDMQNDPCVLIGPEFWDKVGGNGTYKTFITEVNKLGEDYRNRIYREYLGIEPPLSSTTGRLQ